MLSTCHHLTMTASCKSKKQRRVSLAMKSRFAAARPPMNAPTSSEDVSVSDPLISWGSSVHVNEDLRRSIRSEIESLDADIDTLQGNIKNEDRISAQLAKDFAHSRVEMVQLRRSAADELDSAMMREQVRTRLKASLRSELMSPTSVVAVVSPSQNDNSVNATNDSSQNENATNKPPLTTHDYLKEREADLKELATSIAKDKAQVMDKKAQMADLDRQTDAIYARIKSQELEQELEAAKNETALRRQELAEEERLKRTTKEKIQKVRSESAHYAVQIGENVCTIQYYSVVLD